MKLDRAELRSLAGPAAIALLLIVAGIAAMLVTDRFTSDAREELARAKAARSDIQTRLLQATDEERQIRARLVDYQRLRQRGVIGGERRLDWVEVVKSVKEQRGIFDLRYVIDPRRPLEYPGIRRVAGVELLQSRLRLDAEFLHEDDLFAMLADLRERLAPYVLVRSCTLARNPGARSDGFGPHLHSQCVIDLVTIRDQPEGSR